MIFQKIEMFQLLCTISNLLCALLLTKSLVDLSKIKSSLTSLIRSLQEDLKKENSSEFITQSLNSRLTQMQKMRFSPSVIQKDRQK